MSGANQYILIDDFPGYRVGDDGSVWTCRKRCGQPSGGTYVYLSKQWKRLKATKNSDGYLHVKLGKEGKIYTRPVHVLVLRAFLGPCPEGMEACHRDGDRANPTLANLRWGTKSSNAQDKWQHGTMPHGEKHSQAKLTEVQVRQIRSLHGQVAQLAIAKRFNVSLSTIEKILGGQRWAKIK